MGGGTRSGPPTEPDTTTQLAPVVVDDFDLVAVGIEDVGDVVAG
jgi:hypothetical protein